MSTEQSQAKSPPSAACEVRKFLFDLAFDVADCSAEAREKEKPLYTQEQLDAAKKESYDIGFAAGKRALSDEKVVQANALWASIETRLTSVIEDARAEWDQQVVQMRDFVGLIMRKVLPAMAAKGGLEEIEAVARKTISEMASEPRLVIRVPEALFDDAKARIDAVCEKQAYAGKIVLLGDAEMGPSDCRIEWADGGVERDGAGLWQSIEKILGLNPSMTEPVPVVEAVQEAKTADKVETVQEPAADTPVLPPESGEQK